MYKETVEFYKSWVKDPKLLQMLMFKQHKSVTTYDHSRNVTNLSILLAEKMRFSDQSIRNIMIGAMLHDYFLYDYHVTSRHLEDGIHAWSHPRVALHNALQDFELNEIQKNIIRSHMWPVTLLHPPKSKEAWIVSLSDKICATLEWLRPEHDYQFLNMFLRQAKA